MKRLLILSVCMLLTVGSLAAFAAEEKPAIDPESADDITLALSKLAIETKADDISEEAYAAAKKGVLDALGCAMAGYEASGVPAVVEMTKDWGGREEATIWFHGGKVPGPAATFANSVQTHALDLDDFHKPSITHIT
jgi:2-methylcitrate dehydratase PrpD